MQRRKPLSRAMCGSWWKPAEWPMHGGYGTAWLRSSTCRCLTHNQSGLYLGCHRCGEQFAAQRTASAVRPSVAGSNFRGWVAGRTGGHSFGQGPILRTHGSAMLQRLERWTCCNLTCWPTMSRRRIFALGIGMQRYSLHPMRLGVPLWRRWLCNGGSGNSDPGFGSTLHQMYRSSLLGQYKVHGSLQGALSMAGWRCRGLARKWACPQPAVGVGRHRVGFARPATSLFVKPVWGPLSAPSAVMMTRGTLLTTSKSQLSDQVSVTQTSSGCWSCKGALQRLGPLLQMGLTDDDSMGSQQCCTSTPLCRG